MSKEIRFKTLDECFRNPNGFTNEALIEKVISKLSEKTKNSVYALRTLQKDIAEMKHINPVFKENLISYFDYSTGYKKKVSRYKDRSFSFSDSELSAKEKELIKKAVNFLFKIDTKSLGWLDEITNGLSIFKDDNEEKVIFFDERQKKEVQLFFKAIYQAILLKKPVSFDFRQINSQRSEKYLVSPYFLKQFDQKWYLIGRRHYNHKSEVERFPLTRITPDSLVIREDLGLIPATIKAEDYFRDKFGIEDFGKNPETIILKIKRSLYERLNDKPIHSSQYLLRNKQMFEELVERGLIKNKIFQIPTEEDFKQFHYLYFEVEINTNLEKLILSYGSDLMVVYPFKLLKSQRSKIQDMLKNYQTWNKKE